MLLSLFNIIDRYDNFAYTEIRHQEVYFMCVASLKSMTYAVKAKRILHDKGISSEIVKLEPHMTHNGCAYGISFDCVNLYFVTDALTQNHINYTEILNL